MYIYIENSMIHSSELVPLIFELSLRLRPLPVRCPHSDCASRDTIKYGKGRRKNIPDVQRYPVQDLRKEPSATRLEHPTTGNTTQHRSYSPAWTSSTTSTLPYASKLA